MNAGGETADQVVRMSLQGIEVAANIALKVGGDATKSLAAMLYAILTDKKKVKGKARLESMLRSGKELKVFAIRHEDLKLFCEEAKRYGVLYSVLKEKNNTDGICDIMVRAEDASKISRIVDKFELATIDTKAIRESIMNQRSQKEEPFKDVPAMSEQEHDHLVNALMGAVKKEQPTTENPTLARTVKKENQFEHTSKDTKVEDITRQPFRRSVREELKEIKEEKEIKRQQKFRQPTKSKHKNTSKKQTKKKFKSKER